MIDVAIQAAKKAGKILMKHYGNVSAEYKEDYLGAASIVTKADRESEEVIVNILQKNFPDHSIYGEEATDIQKPSPYLWAIDPLDGTSNFVRNIPLFGISIGLLYNGQSILGVLYFPALNLLVHAEKGKGTFANNKRVHVSDREFEKALYYSGGYYHGKLQIERSVADRIGITKIIDASSYELAQIAMGNAELYLLTNVLHDVAAGVVIVKEAGGKVTAYNGSEWTPESEGIVASNGAIHNKVIGLLGK